MMKKRAENVLTQTLQKLLIVFELFGRNELANHAAAGAYGFLLSAAPALLLAVLFVSGVLRESPDAAAELVAGLGGLGTALDAEKLAESYLSAPASGLSAVVAAANLLWMARVFAISLQRGIRVVFGAPQRPRPLRDNAVIFAVEIGAVAYALAAAFSSRAAIAFVEATGLAAALPFLPASLGTAAAVLPVAGLGVLAYLAYRVLGGQKPSRPAAAKGALVCIALYMPTAWAFAALADTSRYDLLYGTMGSLVVLLANVYFFFSYFFLGAQAAFVSDGFDALVFSRFRRISAEGKAGEPRPSALERRVYAAPPALFKKYARAFEDGEVLFARGHDGKEVYYIVSGEIAISLADKVVARLGPGSFFGEMAYLLSEERTATARASGDALALALPPELFEQLLSTDNATARHVIGSLSDRLRKTNESLGGTVGEDAANGPGGGEGPGNGPAGEP